jgi:hypothetical protein
MPFANARSSEDHTGVALEQLDRGTSAQTAEGKDAPLLTYCVNCRDRFRAKGRDTRHLLEILYPPELPVQPASPAKPWKAPTWSLRQENRARFKREMLQKLWGEKAEEAPLIDLIIDEELERKIEETHILHSDIRGVISRAEADQSKIVDLKTGHFLASHRPANVTFWVEYTVENGGFRIYNAYSHRMSAVISGPAIEQGGESANG